MKGKIGGKGPRSGAWGWYILATGGKGRVSPLPCMGGEGRQLNHPQPL